MNNLSPLATPASITTIIQQRLAQLGMPGSLEALEGVLRQLDGHALSPQEAIAELLVAEELVRSNRRLVAYLKTSRLPGVKTLDSFDFSFQPSLDRHQMLSLHELGFLERKENIIFLGPAGVGKTHLAISLAVEAAKRGRRIFFATMADLVLGLVESEKQGRLKERMNFLATASLLVVDEVGYLPITQNGANLFFQLINRRYEKNSTVLTSNKSFREWGEIFGDPVVAAAMLDRLLHHCHLVNIRGNSYRLRGYAGLEMPQDPQPSTIRKRGRPRGSHREEGVH
jgi:DNA replication protein DnaC